MALITCPDCGKQISDKAASCPNCGCPMSEIVTSGPVKIKLPNSSAIVGEMSMFVKK